MPSGHRKPERPFPNSYWVEPGRLLAGEYPGGVNSAETRERLQRLLACGVTTFIDLTREAEMEVYAPLAAKPVEHSRFPILDHSIPERPHMIVDALDAIDAAHRRGQCVYVHCRAGIGRTGMVVAAYLMRRGLDNEQAFDRLQTLWQECGRARRWPIVPETDEQIEYVRRWHEPGRASAAYRDRAEGALTALVLADAIASTASASGAGVELDPNTDLVLPGVLFADSALTLAALDSLLARGSNDPLDQLERYNAWSKSAQNDSRVIVPDALKRALAAWQWSRSRKTYAGSHDPRNLDAHSVSRSLAVALCYPDGGERVVDLAAEVSRTTQQAPIVLDVCRAFAAYALDALMGTPKDVVASGRGPNVIALTHRALKAEVLDVIERRVAYRQQDAGALTALDAALYALARTQSFAGGVQLLLQAATPAAALFGALAGAVHGCRDVPPAWRRSLPQQPTLAQLVEKLPVP